MEQQRRFEHFKEIEKKRYSEETKIFHAELHEKIVYIGRLEK